MKMIRATVKLPERRDRSRIPDSAFVLLEVDYWYCGETAKHMIRKVLQGLVSRADIHTSDAVLHIASAGLLVVESEYTSLLCSPRQRVAYNSVVNLVVATEELRAAKARNGSCVRTREAAVVDATTTLEIAKVRAEKGGAHSDGEGTEHERNRHPPPQGELAR